MPDPNRILWADDEIDLLRPHIRFLEQRGYTVTGVTNGADAVAQVRAAPYDVVFLDEQMPGMGGLEALQEIKAASPELPVVMITKSEEEHLMEDALGRQIADYLIKPVNPKQVLLTLKRLFQAGRLREQQVSQDYLQSFNRITQKLMMRPDVDEWVDIYRSLVRFDLDLEGDENVRQILDDQFREANKEFGSFIESEYPHWIDAADAAPGQARPVLSMDVVPQYVLPHLGERPVVFFVIDCMRYDQWLEFERLLYPFFNIETDFYYSILPTATPYSRNAIFSGLLPVDIARQYPKVWREAEQDEHSKNRFEEDFLADQLRRLKVDTRMRYEKLLGTNDGRTFAGSLSDYLQHDFAAVVINFVDILAHSRSDSDILREIAPDERAYRALTRTWFEHSWLYDAFRDLARQDATVIVTTDHGAVRSLKATKVIGDRETSTALRFKYGRNLKGDERHLIFVRDPETFGLPQHGMHTNYLLAKQDYYFVYPTNYHRYENQYRDTFQHGGATLEEMILPVATLRPRR